MKTFRTILLLSLLLGPATAQHAGPPPGLPPAGSPPGPPPTGTPPGPPPDQAPGGVPQGAAPTTCTAALMLDTPSNVAQASALRAQTIRASAADQSGICVQGNVPVTLEGVGIVTSGPTSSSDRSSFYGLNAGLLAMSGAQVNLNGGSVVTSGSGANAVFSYGTQSRVTVSDTVIRTSGQYAHGVMTAGGGSVTATNLTASTLGENSAVIATDRGGGSIRVQGGRYGTAGVDSPGVYSTGEIQIQGASVTAAGAEAAVIEGSNRIEVTDSDLRGSRKSGVMLYQSFSGDAQGEDSHFDMVGGQLSAAAGPLFYVTNASGTVTLRGVQTRAASGILLRAAADDWGRAGQNGGRAALTGSVQTLQGDVTADVLSTATLTLKDHSVWTGAFNTSGTAKSASLTLDASSVWKVTAASRLTALSGAVIERNRVVNIQGPFIVTYDAGHSPALRSLTYTLVGGGQLKPQ